MASGPITSWQIEGEKVEVVTDFIFLGFKIAADGDCSHEIKRRLLLERKATTKALLQPHQNSSLPFLNLTSFTPQQVLILRAQPHKILGCQSPSSTQ